MEANPFKGEIMEKTIVARTVSGALNNKKALANELQLTPQLMGLSTNMVSMACGVSASRGQMEGGQAAQTLVLNNPDYPRTWTGVEQEMAKYTFAARATSTCDVIRVIDRFRTGLGKDSFISNPYTMAVVRNADERGNKFDLIEIPSFYSFHNNFGYMTVPQPALKRLRRPNARFNPGDVLVDSPGNGPEGFYRRGLLTHTIYMTTPWATEDGYWAANEWCDRATATGIGEMFVTVPRGHYLVPVNGTPDNPKFLPSLGEKIRPDGMVLCTREADPILDMFHLSAKGLSDVDLTFDEPKYIEGSCRNATVLEIEVFVNEQEMSQIQPVMLDEMGNEIPNQLMQIWEEHKRYSREFIETYEEIERSCPSSRPAQYSGRLTNEISKAMHIANYKSPKSVKFTNYSTLVPTATIRIKYKYDIVPEIGSKISGDYGDKGVICRKTPLADMPMDKYGVRAELVVHANATINRMISVRLDDHYLGAQCLRREAEIRELWDKGQWEDAFDIAARMYEIVSPRAFREKFVPFMVTNERRKNHVKSIVDGHMMFELKHNDFPNHIHLTDALETEWPYDKGPVIFRNTRGALRKTKGEQMIGTNYIRVLEKTGHDWGAVDSPARQAHGIAAKISHRDRHSRPYRKQPYRYGEAEFRPIAAIVGADWAADILDRSNNPKASEEIFTRIMEADKPSAIHRVIDRDKIPVGSSVTHQYLNNALYTSGARFHRKIVDKKGNKRR